MCLGTYLTGIVRGKVALASLEAIGLVSRAA
jgi:hypothetical protein